MFISHYTGTLYHVQEAAKENDNKNAIRNIIEN